MDTLEKAELTASICRVRFLKSGMPIYNSQVQDKIGQKQGEYEEHRQLQSVMHFMQTQ